MWTRDASARCASRVRSGPAALGQLESERVLDAVRRLQAVRPRPRARRRRARRLHGGSRSTSRRRKDGGRLAGKVALVTARRRHRARGCALFAGRAHRLVADRDAAAGEPPGVAGGGDRALACDVARGADVKRPSQRPSGTSARSTCCSTTPGSSPRRTARPVDSPRRLRAREGGEPGPSSWAEARNPRAAGRRRRLDRQHGVVRRGDGRGDLADRIHREQGRRARDDARDRGRVRAPGHSRELAVPGPGQYALLAEFFARPRAARAGSCTSRWGDSRKRARSRTRRCSSRATTVELCDGLDVPGGRRASSAYMTPL